MNNTLPLSTTLNFQGFLKFLVRKQLSKQLEPFNLSLSDLENLVLPKSNSKITITRERSINFVFYFYSDTLKGKFSILNEMIYLEYSDEETRANYRCTFCKNKNKAKINSIACFPYDTGKNVEHFDILTIENGLFLYIHFKESNLFTLQLNHKSTDTEVILDQNLLYSFVNRILELDIVPSDYYSSEKNFSELCKDIFNILKESFHLEAPSLRYIQNYSNLLLYNDFNTSNHLIGKFF